MSKSRLCVQLLAVVVVAAGVLLVSSPDPQGVYLTTAGVGDLTQVDTSAVLVLAETDLSLPRSGGTSEQATAVCSPPPQCFRDRDCDPICGKRNGVCVAVNSCYRECACKS